MGANVAQCKICGERMGWASGKAYGGPAGDVGQVVGAMLAIQEVVDPSDPNYQKLGEFIETGAALSKALHEAAHSRGMVPNREPWRRWQETSIGVIEGFKAAYPGILDDQERMHRGGQRARAAVLRSGVPPVGTPSTTALAKQLMRLERENPIAWDFGESRARVALDTRSPYLIEKIHADGEEGARFYAEEISREIPGFLRESVAAGELDIDLPLSEDAQEAARLAAFTSLMDWLTAEPR